jgi:hypothetical protein
MSRLIRRTVLAAVLVLLAGSAAHAGTPGLRFPGPSPVRAGWLGAAWEWIALRLAPAPRAAPSWEKAGCGMDPDGKPKPECGEEPSPAAGGMMDPDGKD